MNKIFSGRVISPAAPEVSDANDVWATFSIETAGADIVRVAVFDDFGLIVVAELNTGDRVLVEGKLSTHKKPWASSCVAMRIFRIAEAGKYHEIPACSPS